jgi:hypothetical protein
MEMLNKGGHRTAKAGRPLISLLLVLVSMVIGSGTWSARASGLGDAAGQAQQVASSAGPAAPEATCPSGGQCFADVTSGNPFYAFINRIYQQDLVSGYPCGGPGEPCDPSNRPYYRPANNVTRGQMAKFIDNARNLPQIHMQVSAGNTPIFSQNDTGTAIAAYSTSGQALVAQSSTSLAIYAQTGDSIAISGFSTGGTNGVGVSGQGTTGVSGSGLVGVKGTGDTGSYGVWGNNSAGIGVYGSSNTGYGVEGRSNGDPGVHGISPGNAGVYGQSTTSYGVEGQSSNSDAVYGTSGGADGVHGTSSAGYGVEGDTSGGVGVEGNSTGGGTGVHGISDSATGVFGDSTTGTGTLGQSGFGDGVYGNSTHSNGVEGFSGTGNGVYGSSTSGWAGYFQGNVHVTGSCCAAAAGTTQVDDPLDPANKVLNQSLVQSPDMTTVINGNVTLDGGGEATVPLPAWFEAANGDFRYILTAVGAPGPDLYIAQELSGNQFKIAGGRAGAKVSWQVTGVRHDPYAAAHPIQPEQAKPAAEQGKYLYPTEYGQPASSGVDYGRHQQAAKLAP